VEAAASLGGDRPLVEALFLLSLPVISCLKVSVFEVEVLADLNYLFHPLAIWR
jgi:hypothetical protein